MDKVKQYLAQVESENEYLRAENIKLTDQLEQLQFDVQLLKDAEPTTKKGTFYITVGSEKVLIHELNHMSPRWEYNWEKGRVLGPDVNLVVCTNCMTVGVNNQDNMLILVSVQNSNARVCRHCRTNTKLLYTNGEWQSFKKKQQKVVKKKRWFTGKNIR